MEPLWQTPPGFAAVDMTSRLAGVGSASDADAAADSDFSAFYECTFRRVYAFVRSQVASADVAQDLVSRAFVKAYRRWPTSPRGEAATFWVFRIARNTLIDYWRVDGRHESVNVSLDELAERPATGANPEAACSEKERAALLLRVIGSLDTDDRIVLSLKFTGQRTNREIAAILAISEGAVSMRLLRALRRLRQRLTEAGVS